MEKNLNGNGNISLYFLFQFVYLLFNATRFLTTAFLLKLVVYFKGRFTSTASISLMNISYFRKTSLGLGILVYLNFF